MHLIEFAKFTHDGVLLELEPVRIRMFTVVGENGRHTWY